MTAPMTGDYHRPHDKVAVLSDRLRERKSALVAAEGVSFQSELSPHLVAWRGGALVAVFRMGERLTMTNERKRPAAVAYAARMLRRTWGADALSYVEEAFVAYSPDEVEQDRTLAEQFPTNLHIHEALVVMHSEDGDLQTHSMPFTIGLDCGYEVGGRPAGRRTLTWLTPAPFVGEEASHLDRIADLLVESLVEPPALADVALTAAVVQSLEEMGWLTVEVA